MAETQEARRSPREGVCVCCDRILPKTAFRRDAAGRFTAWCEACREAAARRWGVEGDLVESVYALFVLEHAWKAEAESVMQIRIHQGQEHPNELSNLHNRMASYERIRLTRIPERLRHFHAEARGAYYNGISMAMPAEAPADQMGLAL